MIAYTLMKNGIVVGGEVFTMASADAAFPTLVAKLLPAGVKGVLVCGIMAALMSSLASLFNSSAMLFTIDFYKKFRPQSTEKQLLYIGRVATVVIVGLGILWIPVMKSVGSVLYEYLQDVQSILSPGIAAAFLLGILSKRITPKGGMWGLISGFIIGIIRLSANVYYSANPHAAGNWFRSVFYDFNWLFFSGCMLVTCMLVVIVVSLFTKQALPAQIQGLTFASTTPEQKAATRASWNHWDIIHSCIILGIITLFYIYFW
jgi:SSS family solute:Na+ symporter